MLGLAVAPATLCSILSGDEIPKHPDGIATERPCDRDELDDVDPALTALVLGDERLWPAEFFSQGLLTNSGVMSRCNEDGKEPTIFLGFERFLHAPPGP
jgi:hypothetical protein